MKYRFPRLSFLLTACLLLSACGSESTTSAPPPDPKPATETRGFYMGFTPWPYDATLEAIDTTYRKTQQHGDIIDHQLMQGIPWDEAFNNNAYPADVEDKIGSRLAKTQAGKVVFLAIDSLDPGRNGLANNWGASENEPRTAPWDSRDFDSPQVITAYTRFALDMIARFQPAYFNYGTEASELILNDLAAYNRFKVFAQAVYGNIKADYPDLKLMVSIAMKSPGSSEMQQIKQNIADILPYMDVIGVSVYPYIFYNHADKANPASLPADWLSQIKQVAPGKPVAITETGWIAEPLVINAYGVNLDGNESWQRQYVARLLQESEQLDVEFAIWWSLIDFQALWDGVLAQDPVASIWRDTGLYNEQIQPRAGLEVWQRYLDRQRL